MEERQRKDPILSVIAISHLGIIRRILFNTKQPIIIITFVTLKSVLKSFLVDENILLYKIIKTLLLLRELIFIVLFVVTAAGVVSCVSPKKRPVHLP